MAVLVGARPVFVDVLPDTYNLDPQDLKLRIDECIRQGWGRPRAVVPVHEFGLAADMDPIMAIAAQYSLAVIEDAACALGASYHGKPVGTLGALGTFSFHPRKSITTGEGGAIVTNDNDLADRCRSWRNHGQKIINGQREFVLPGLNYRMTEIQGAIGRVQMTKLPEIMKQRSLLAQAYFSSLADLTQSRLPINTPEQTWQTFMIVLDETLERQKVMAAMTQAGFDTGPGSVAGHLGGQFRASSDLSTTGLPVSTRLHHSGLALPLYAGLEAQYLKQISAALRRHVS